MTKTERENVPRNSAGKSITEAKENMKDASQGFLTRRNEKKVKKNIRFRDLE